MSSSSLTRSDQRLGVLHLTDTLIAAGYERVALNLANGLAPSQYRSHLGTTRREGPLAELVAPHVGRLRLNRRWWFDLGALRRLSAYVRDNQIQILHAHGTTVFIAAAAASLCRTAAVIWHNHAGRLARARKGVARWRLASRRVDMAITVSDELRHWCVQTLGMAPDRVRFIPNAAASVDAVAPLCDLPGRSGSRVVSVAHLLPDKDPINLLRAMKQVATAFPEAHLLMVGSPGDSAYMAAVQAELSDPILKPRVTLLGLRNDVQSILRSCDVGVLSSVTEGFPVALLEYGLASLPAVATAVGQCEDILEGGRVGLVAPPSSPERLAAGIVALLNSPNLRQQLGAAFRKSVCARYSPDVILKQIEEVYALARRAKATCA